MEVTMRDVAIPTVRFPYNGVLTPNEIFGTIYNQILSQEVFADNVKGTYSTLVDKARVDGGLYGDTKLYYSTDILQTETWGKDASNNVLEIRRPKDPKCQAIQIDVFKQISLTVDSYLSKRAWSTEAAFSSFNSVMLGWIRETKRVYDSTLYNCYIGTTETKIGKQQHSIIITDDENPALRMAEDLASILVDLKDVSRDYNDYKFMRSYNEEDFIVVWNAKQYNALKKIDMPVIFHNEGLLNEFDQEVLPSKYFGTLVGNTDDEFTVSAESTNIYRTAVETDVVSASNDKDILHLIAGEEIPKGYKAKENESYIEDDTIAFKLIHKRSVPYMSGFEVGTSFFNAKNLSENHYLTFGHNTLDYLKNYPMITARKLLK
jgi:hypothetical protein